MNEPYYWAYSPQLKAWVEFYLDNKSGFTQDRFRRCLCNVCVIAYEEKRGSNFKEVFESWII